MFKKLILAGAVVFAAGCDGAVDDLAKALDELPAGKAVIQTKVTVASGASKAPAQAGTNAADGLLSMKYYIRGLGICKTAEIQGTGFSMGPECIELYAPEPNADYQINDIPLAADYKRFMDLARTDDNPDFIDLMSAASRERMARTIELTDAHVGEYNYGYVYWYYPIKFSAQMTLSDGTTIYSHDGTSATFDDANGFTHINTISATPFTQGPAEEAVVANQNGGAWFKFQAPFTISAEDITAGTEFELKLAFNPEGVVRGAGPNTGGGLQLRDFAYGATGYSFEVPILDLSPVVHRKGETAMRESYVFTVNTPTGNEFALRYDLYFVQERPETLLAVETKSLVTPASIDNVAGAYTVSFVETAEDGALSFLKWDNSPILTNFKRAANAGDAVTGTLHCEDVAHQPHYWCDLATMTNDLSGTLVEVTTVE